MEKFYEYEKDVHMCFVDFRQAYNSIVRDKLWNALEVFEIPKNYSLDERVLHTYLESCEIWLWYIVEKKVYEVKTGLKQGNVLSPVFF